MKSEIESQVKTLQTLGASLSLVCAGAGTSLIHWLHIVPGASAIMQESSVIYGKRAQEFYFPDDEKAVSPERAHTMAEYAHQLAEVAGPEHTIVGVAITAALPSNYVRRGENHAWCSIVREGTEEIWEIKGRDNESREELEERISESVLSVLVGVLSANPA